MKPTKQQADAVEASLTSPITLIQATAGSGKTATLVRIIERHLENGTRPEDVIALTYTQAAGREIRRRVNAPIGYAGTLHAFCMREMRISPQQLLTEAEAYALVSFVAGQFPRVRKQDIRIGLQTPGDLTGDLGLAVRQYRIEMARRYGRDRVCFDTILWQAHRDRVAEKCLWGLLLIDEAQDTNPLDAGIYGQFESKSTVVVGDPNQAIYGFRGASPSWLKRLWRMQPQAEKLRLTITFRCAQAICDYANRLMNGAGSDYFPMTAATGRGGGGVRSCWFTHREEEIRDACVWAATEAEQGRSVAILTQYNATVAIIQATMAMTAPSARVAKKIKPEEYALVMAALRTVLSPQDDRPRFALEWGNASRTNIMSRVIARWGSLSSCAEAAATLAQTHGAPWATVLALPAWAEERISAEGWTPEEALMAFARAEEDAKENPGTIYVGTIHSAKGAEWDAVAVVGADVPAGKPLDPEDRRILYVGFTRAREALWVGGAQEAPAHQPGARQLRSRIPNLT